MNKKIKVLTISDHLLSFSGVALQSRLIVEALLKTGKFQVISLGGAIKHKNYTPIKTEEYGDDFKIYPVDGFGTPDIVRSVMRTERPDIMYIQGDPRFFSDWLFLIENEIRPLIPIVWNHLWDNYPAPKFNKKFYESVDQIVAISKISYDMMGKVAPNTPRIYIPHTEDPDTFKQLDETSIQRFLASTYGQVSGKEVVKYLFVSRNARRKHSGTLIYWFKKFLDKVGHDKAILTMHTNPKDEHGPDLIKIIKDFGMNKGQVRFSTSPLTNEQMALLYASSDWTVNISDAEGFGLSAENSLCCGTPVIITKTGGLQDQVDDGVNGFVIEPSSRTIVGSQSVPYILEDRISEKDFLEKLHQSYKISSENPEKYKEMSENALKIIDERFNHAECMQKWVDLMLEMNEKYGSWNTRKGYKTWEARKIT